MPKSAECLQGLTQDFRRGGGRKGVEITRTPSILPKKTIQGGRGGWIKILYFNTIKKIIFSKLELILMIRKSLLHSILTLSFECFNGLGIREVL